GEGVGLGVGAVVFVDVLDPGVGDLGQREDVHTVQGGQERGGTDVLHVVWVGGGGGEGDQLGIGEVTGDLGLTADLTRGRLLAPFVRLAVDAACGRVRVCAATVGGHHGPTRAARALLAVAQAGDE